jgi:hypothetical protein
MGKRFHSFKDASIYARTLAKEKNTSVRVARDANTWLVLSSEQETGDEVVEQRNLAQEVDRTVGSPRGPKMVLAQLQATTNPLLK